MYLLHRKYATDPRHYVRAFLLIQQDMLDLFSYVEPSDRNLDTYSHRIQQLLMRTCVEIEANFTAIFLDNEFSVSGRNFTINDYKLINKSHRLSSFETRVPGWIGDHGIRQPFASWAEEQPLSWYRAYNKSKHNRHENFHLATFDSLIDAFCALNILLSAQFMDEEYGPGGKSIGLSGSDYFYEGDDGMEPSIGDILRVRFPDDWPANERYDFNWQELRNLEDPFENFDYAAYS
ncbi:hypothetical protein [Halomonas sp. Mc5H-6]|uniref:hypothetical protein n=1 Tax=Halomonas sp. Mc5H-6 TaxID=2954500 RepID=UPI00209765E7|nr:hypothetical protein [Halomonas sp. Mc5H-6]MCO7246915.1 hypothetical protein [Halomonas sp. Mc5H-6]